MLARLAPLLFIVTFLAGCAASDGADPQDPSTSTPTPTEDPDGGEEEPEPDEPWTTHWYLDEDGLIPEDPGAGSVPLDCGYRAFAGACDIADGEYLSAAFEVPVHAVPQRVTVDLWLETDGVAIGNPVFDIAVWFGSSRGSAAFTFASNVVMTTGEPTQVSLDMGFQDHPGIALPAGESLLVRILGAYEPEGAGLHRILTGGDTPSGFTMTLQNLTEPPVGPVTESDTFTGTLQGGTFVECPPGDTIHRFTVPEDATHVDLRLTAQTPAGDGDVDLDLYDGSTVIAHAGSPYTEEEILLAGPALEPYLGKELGAGTTICLGPTAEYTIELEIGAAETG